MGYPVAHSRSPIIHGYWLRELGIAGAYDLKELTPEAFPEFLTHLAQHGYVGGNITVPHKQTAFALVERRDEAAEAIGAVNTVWLEGSNLVGGNSDAHGFIANLDDRAPGWDVRGGEALIIGAGGAARAAAYGILRRGLSVSLVNRTMAHEQELARQFPHKVRCGGGFEALPDELPRADLLVNCTPLGMNGKPPLAIDLEWLKRTAVVCDVVYVPLETALLAAARARGHRVVDGLGMLLQQAGFGFHKWFGAQPKVTPDLRALIEADLKPGPSPPAADQAPRSA